MRSLALTCVVIVLVLGCGIVACSTAGPRDTTSTSADPYEPVDYSETHPLVQGEFDNRHYPKYAE